MSVNTSTKKDALYYLEILPIIENADEIWSLLTLLALFWNDKFVQTQICHKLYSFKTVDVDYFLPQFWYASFPCSPEIHCVVNW
jgi:hypothetical protein